MAFFVGFGLLVNFVLPKPVATALRFVLPVVFLFGLGYTFQRMLFSRGRWFRLQLLPAVVHSLTPWHVAHDEIESGLERLKDQGYLFPRKISADKLWTRLQSHTIQLRPLSSLSATSAAA
jgi:hypothetical protein